MNTMPGGDGLTSTKFMMANVLTRALHLPFDPKKNIGGHDAGNWNSRDYPAFHIFYANNELARHLYPHL
jgi:hypothetical protein